MITEKLKIYGEKSKARLVSELLHKCSEKLTLSISQTQVFLPDCSEVFVQNGITHNLILDYKDAGKLAENTQHFTYSLTDSRADVTALNVQQREHCVCFELLKGSFMSRVFIPHSSEHTPETVLVVCSVLFMWSVSAEQIVEVINELLK